MVLTLRVQRVDWQELVVVVALGLLFPFPGYWLFRDARKRGRNAVLWVTLYAIAVVPHRLRFVLVPAVFGAWFLLRDRDFGYFKRFARLILARKAPARPIMLCGARASDPKTIPVVGVGPQVPELRRLVIVQGPVLYGRPSRT